MQMGIIFSLLCTLLFTPSSTTPSCKNALSAARGNVALITPACVRELFQLSFPVGSCDISAYPAINSSDIPVPGELREIITVDTLKVHNGVVSAPDLLSRFWRPISAGNDAYKFLSNIVAETGTDLVLCKLVYCI